jgi:beta-lactamase superfamily II metal-dependent hydrolase
MFSIEMLPAKDGDCLWIEYGKSDEVHRVVIDGGPLGACDALRNRIDALPVSDRKFELLIVTHIDSDHIAGVVKLFQDPPKGLFLQQVWFNAYRHLAEGYLGAKEAEFLTVYLQEIEDKRPGFWNGAFDGKAVVVPDGGPFPQCTLDGGLKLTVLAPDAKALRALKRAWDKVIRDYMTPGSLEEARELLKKDKRYRPGYLGGIDVHGLAEAPFEEDTAAANGSSIVVVAEYEQKKCLLAADAFPSKISAGLKRLNGGGLRCPFAVVKIPHHGSHHNNSNELYQGIDSPVFLISTDGSKHEHPDQEAIARILDNKRRKVKLVFNYTSTFNSVWNNDRLKDSAGYTTCYASDENGGRKTQI